MKTFLHDIAEKIYNSHPKLNEVTLVFPNRRAILFFRKYLGTLISKPMFAPRLLTIEEFIGSFSTLNVPDKLELVHRLYRAYTETLNSTESFDQFYFWGEMLVRDFDEVDKYLVNAEMLFRDLSHQKELDASFDYLTEAQKTFLLDFWLNFDAHKTENKEKFLEVWKRLGDVYNLYRKQLHEEGLAYEGMVHREVAEKIEQQLLSIGTGHEIFIGFNALTKAEEVILAHAVDRGAQVYWDLDEYYLNNQAQEAGDFFREYQEHKALGKTFDAEIPANFRKPKTVNLYGAAQPVGQAKLMGQVLADSLSEGMVPEETLIVLPDEKLLLPVLHSVSDHVTKLNVTMGFPLGSTPVFNFIELLIELQISAKDKYFHHRPVLSLLNHPYVIAADAAAAQAKRKDILDHNWVSVPEGFLVSQSDLHRIMFKVADTNQVISYLRNNLALLGSLKTLADFDKEYMVHMLKSLNRLEEVLGSTYADLRSFLRFFRQYVRAQKIPFSGEPLQGLQIMGMLETRNLDFKNVFILSLNEGSLPSGASKGSYIPYNIRRAYGLPTVQHQDAMYAYLFYRVIQRAEKVSLFYNTETDILGQGEMSRYLQQLLVEGNLKITPKTLHNEIHVSELKPIVIHKDDAVMQQLARLNDENPHRKFRGLSPSALNTYIECKLRFYFNHVARIREANEIEEDMDARVLGNFVHNIMERFYKNLVARKGTKQIEAKDLEDFEKYIPNLLDQEVIAAYHLNPDNPVRYEGQLILVSEVVKRFIKKIIEHDKKHAPFTLMGVEEILDYKVSIGSGVGKVMLGGKLDRIDKKDNVLRIVDYKTGRDSLEFKTIDSLFDGEGTRNKAAFQTLLYAWLYTKAHPEELSRIIPGLMNSKNLFSDSLVFGLMMDRKHLTDAAEVLPEFEQKLKALLEELFNPKETFHQTSNVKACEYCPYKRICYR